MIDGPRELNGSGVVGVVYWLAATASDPFAEAASGLIALELVGNSAMVKAGVPPTMYFMNGVPVPPTRRMPMPSVCVPEMPT